MHKRPMRWVETDEDGTNWYETGAGMLTCDGSRCRMWFDDPPRSENGSIVIDRLYFECVDCHAVVHLEDFMNGACVRDGFALDQRGE